MSPDELERLHKLAELRDRGVLSEDEFQSAKSRLLAGSTPARRPGAGRPSGKPSFVRANWPAFAGVGVLLLLIIGVIVYGKLTSSGDDSDMNIAIGNAIDGNVLGAVDGEALCASGATYQQIKERIFDRAVQQSGDDAAPLNSLRKTVGVRMEYPLLRGNSSQANRTDCSGHLILDLPPTVREAFDGAATLEADLEFSVLPAADGSGNVVQPNGTDFIVQQLVTAAALVGQQQAVAAAQKTFNPSFECGARLSNVERMICQDEALSQLDRRLAERYSTLKRALLPGDWEEVADSQTAFLQRRAACADVPCVRDAYRGQQRELELYVLSDEGPE